MTYNFKNSTSREIFIELDDAINRDDAADRRAAFDALKDADPAARAKALDALEEKLVKQAGRDGERAYFAIRQEESLAQQPSRIAELREYQAEVKKFMRTFTELHIAADGLAEISREKGDDAQRFTKAFAAEYANLSHAGQYDTESVARAAAKSYRAVDKMEIADKINASATDQKDAADARDAQYAKLKQIEQQRKQKNYSTTRSSKGPTVC